MTKNGELSIDIPGGSIDITNHQEFLKEFLENYLSRGFGTLGKREVDVLLMHLLCEYSTLNTCSNYDLSTTLQIPEGRVPGLRYEARLKYTKNKTVYIKEKLLTVLVNLQFKAEKDVLQIAIDDKLVYSDIQARLKNMGLFGDTSYNREVLKIPIDGFCTILNDLLDPAERKSFMTAAKKAVDKAKWKDAGFTFPKLVGTFVNGSVGAAGKATVVAATGGISEVPSLLGKLGEFAGALFDKGPNLQEMNSDGQTVA